MTIKRVKPLIKGDTIGLTAPAGPVDSEKLQVAISRINEMGFNVEVGKTCYEKYGGYLAGTPENRAKELNAMFMNKGISAIFCLRGGYGSMHLLPLLNYEAIAMNPKLFVGYSDITALHIVLQQKCHLPTIHGPMPASDLVNANDFTIQSLKNVLLQYPFKGKVKNPDNERIGCLVPGTASGMLIGGNLSVLVSTLGTPYEIDTKGKILFLEDIGEEPYRIDRMLTQLALAGKFSESAGIVLGTWTECTSERYSDGFKVEDLFGKIIAPIGKPTIFNVKAGHGNPTLALPLGLTAYMDAENGWLSFG
ncbi:muramoyltetrapeptide carboxypeptidase [Lederbergia wuyishanensis]|uniref:Muramoyltetrapeptide carboxypeptidase n=1 Tax=Lederbergia wuyishanensis TaxID=1347903 RepID=A0ABU0D3S0_9BACI|nr:LD-carboxypeptidase [Lederbergia wuyishanensis]MCJ8007777.1 LD-carboxypeptidase [Lederbergia wuyishanensis]MDQ0343060.1 muramoyltetrapeptide carboxypeptidase [Lederbergia wuyishanensis]